LVVSTSVVDCLERLVSEMICFCGVDIKPYSLTCVDGLVQCCSRPSVHWRCWSGSRKSIWAVNITLQLSPK